MVNIDRESVCSDILPVAGDPGCELDFKVAATTGQFFQTIEVKVIVLDINDNAPMFPQDRFELKISEDANKNARFSILSADDLDTGENNGIQSYTIDPPSNVFDLDSELNLDGTVSVEIIVNQALDREITDSYQLRIVAVDGGNPPKSGILTVDVIVTDVNDNKPKFDEQIYNVSVEEGTSFGTTVLSVHATDLDTGLNGKISYRISDRFGQILNDFSIDDQTGDIKVAKEKLVFQPDFYYSFIVEAVDSGEQVQVSQVWVHIYVTDTGNNPPKVTLSLLSPGNIGFVNVSENSKNGSFVAHVTVDDTDTGANGLVSCFVSNNYFSVAQLQEEDAFKVVVSNTLNREVLDLHNVTVICADQGEPPLSSSVSFLVRVTDYNDNKPEFERINYVASIAEHTSETQIVLQVSAVDKDIGNNSRIHYEIRNQDKIAVNAVTGVISVKPYFDREVTPIVVFEVLAIDSGEVPLTGTATVTLSIDDINDNPPLFTQDSFSFEILENLNSGTTVGKFSATDIDIGANGIFTFSLSPVYISQRIPFTVFSDGVIQSNRALDREEQSRYDFEVIVTDQGSPSLSSSVIVTIMVSDMNDNHPNITFPTKTNYTVSMYYPNNIGEIITHIKANDLDSGENGSLTYSIMKGNELGLFQIDRTRGIISIADNTIVIDQDISIALEVKVEDGGFISLSSSNKLIVDVIYTNATYETVQGEGSKFVVIVVVVVVVTVLLSALIIGIIFLLRTIDKRKSLAASKTVSVNENFTNKQSVYIMNNTGESSTDYMVTGPDGSKKKKEVSFSFDDHDSINNYQQADLQVKMSPDPIKYAPDKPPRLEKSDSTQDLYDKVTTRLESLKLQHKLQMAKQQQQHQVSHINPEDSRSETSGETSSGDSGRGTSEEEVPSASPSHDDQKMFDYSVPIKVSTPSSQSRTAPPMSRTDNYSVVPPPIPCRTYKPYGSFNDQQSYSSNNRQYPSAPLHYNSDLSVLDPSSLPWQHSQAHTNYPNNSFAQNDLSYFLPDNSQYRRRSQDDDDCSTTTSGSYTLHSIEDLL
ncbi:hypothetical protein ACF0H5_010405 [Mactra antiquata]